MELTYQKTKISFSILVLLFVAIAALLVASVGLNDLPFTNHAEQSHAQEKWNARSIAAYMDAGYCKPRKYECPGDNADLYVCDLENDLSIGLWVGRFVQRVITGYAAPHDYWNNRLGCTLAQ